MPTKKIAIVTTHAIQYNAPWFKLLAEFKGISLKVFYTWSQAEEKVQDKTFGQAIKWDIPLLEGYEYEFVENISKNPGSNRWKGIENPELISKILLFKPDAVLVFGWNMKSHFKVMRYFKDKIPVLFRGDSTLLNEQNGARKLLRRLWLTLVFRYIDKALYVGQENKKYFKAHGLREEQLTFTPHAIDNNRFFDSDSNLYERKAEEWRKKLGYLDDDLVVLFAGKFEKNKNLSLLVRAVQEINSSKKKCLKLLMIGNGPLEREIKSITKNDDNIGIMPFQNQSVMPIVYRLGDVYCLPSNSETWGLAVNEAMTCSRPVLVSDKVGCAPDLVKDEHVGYIFSSGNAMALKEYLLRLSKEKLKEQGENAKQVISEWSFENICKAVIKELK